MVLLALLRCENAGKNHLIPAYKNYAILTLFPIDGTGKTLLTSVGTVWCDVWANDLC